MRQTRASVTPRLKFPLQEGGPGRGCERRLDSEHQPKSARARYGKAAATITVTPTVTVPVVNVRARRGRRVRLRLRVGVRVGQSLAERAGPGRSRLPAGDVAWRLGSSIVRGASPKRPRLDGGAAARRCRIGRAWPLWPPDTGPGPGVFRLATCGEGPGPLSPEGRGTVAGPSGNSRQEHPNRRRHWRWLWLLPGSIVSQGGAPGGRSDRPLRRARRRADLVRARPSLGGIAQLMILAGPMPSPIQVF